MQLDCWLSISEEREINVSSQKSEPKVKSEGVRSSSDEGEIDGKENESGGRSQPNDGWMYMYLQGEQHFCASNIHVDHLLIDSD